MFCSRESINYLDLHYLSSMVSTFNLIKNAFTILESWNVKLSVLDLKVLTIQFIWQKLVRNYLVLLHILVLQGIVSMNTNTIKY